jgi:hypothetical protein
VPAVIERRIDIRRIDLQVDTVVLGDRNRLKLVQDDDALFVVDCPDLCREVIDIGGIFRLGVK